MSIHPAGIEVGASLPSVTHGPITRAELALYAANSGDLNPIHLDDHIARQNNLPGVVVHGMLSMAFLAQVLTNWTTQDRIRRFGGRFSAMAYPGDTVTCRGVIEAVATVDGQTLVDIGLTAENQNGEALLTGKAQVAL